MDSCPLKENKLYDQGSNKPGNQYYTLDKLYNSIKICMRNLVWSYAHMEIYCHKIHGFLTIKLRYVGRFFSLKGE